MPRIRTRSPRACASGRPGISGRPRPGRTASSARWLQRQLHDPYVRAARQKGYRSRAAFKLLELDQRLDVLGSARRIVDLGAAPGSWCQVAASGGRRCLRVVGVDVLAMEPVPGCVLLQGDVMAAETEAAVVRALGGPADVVLSDLAPQTTGHRPTDHLRIMALAEGAADVAFRLLAPGGACCIKIWQGGGEQALRQRLAAGFAAVRWVKPAASRAESREIYLVAQGFLHPRRPQAI